MKSSQIPKYRLIIKPHFGGNKTTKNKQNMYIEKFQMNWCKDSSYNSHYNKLEIMTEIKSIKLRQ